MKNTAVIVIGIILSTMIYSFSCVISYNKGYKQPPFKVVQATEIIDGQYTLKLQDHSFNEFLITLTIEKALALGIDTNEIILLSNQ